METMKKMERELTSIIKVYGSVEVNGAGGGVERVWHQQNNVPGGKRASSTGSPWARAGVQARKPENHF